jgi:signal transduction histidine kinase/CheY-like chemotaxis protein/CHASE3 domain sensor protein/HPt (histidine-containing phosphotransfer) domain-containing protein
MISSAKAERLAALGYGIGTVLLVIIGASLYAAIDRGQRSSLLVDRTLQSLESIARIDAAMRQAESAQRGVLLYSEGRFVMERDDALAAARAELTRLKGLGTANSPHPARVSQLAGAIEERATRMRDTLLPRLLASYPLAPLASTGVGGAMGARIKGIMDSLRDEQAATLAEHKAEGLAHAQEVGWILVVSSLLLAGIIVPGYLGFLGQSRAYRGSQRRIRDLADSLPGAVFQLRAWYDGRLKYELLSAGTREVRGIDPKAGLQDAGLILDSVYEPDRALFRETILRGIASMTPTQMDYRVVLPDGKLRWIRSVSSPSSRRDGSVVLSGHWADITVQKEMEAGLLAAVEAAAAANQAKTRFVATISHEIRTPLHGMLAILELLGLTKLDKEQSTNLHAVREAGQSLIRIINDLLDFSKIEENKLDVVPEAANLGALLECVVDVFAVTAKHKGLDLRHSVDANIPPLLVFDPVRVRQILANLVSNAIKFTSRGEVLVSARLVHREGGEAVVQLDVNDTGIGMTLEEQKRVFEGFTQANKEITGRYGGSGLGLWIARRLAELMGGRIEMRSEPGSGTQMQVTLPMKVTRARTAFQRLSKAGAPAWLRHRTAIGAGRERARVLVVDDHPINLMAMQQQLDILGYGAESAASGCEALEKLTSERFAAVFMDCNMPGMSGYELAGAVRELEARTNRERMPIIACTANALPGEAEKCLGAGMDDYLAKPADLAAVARKLERWLRPPPIDGVALAQISTGDANGDLDVLKRFREYNDGDAVSLRDAVRHRSTADLLSVCHRIKGAGGTVGASQLTAACEDVERHARAGNWGAIGAAMESFEREVKRLDAYIDTRSTQ